MTTTINASSSSGLITTADTSTILQLQTNGTAALTIDASANVGIGTASPATKLHLYGATDQRIRFENTGWTKAYQIGNDQNALSFYDVTASAERMRIDSSGNVGIGTNGPSRKLVVSNAGAAGFEVGPGVGLSSGNEFLNYNRSTSLYVQKTEYASAYVFFAGTAGSTRAVDIDSSGNLLVAKTGTSVGTVGTAISPSGRVQISNAATTSADDGIQIYSTGASAYRFFVGMGGQINATSTSITAISDVSLKENIRDLETGLSEVLQLKPRRFDWKEETQLEQKNIAGFIAQELEEVLPDLVYEYKYSDTETKKSIKMGDILPTLVKAIQEQQAIITSLTDRITALEGTTP